MVWELGFVRGEFQIHHFEFSFVQINWWFEFRVQLGSFFMLSSSAMEVSFKFEGLRKMMNSGRANFEFRELFSLMFI